jgi:hypothetical protein
MKVLILGATGFNIRVTGTDAIVKIVDHWTLRGGKAISLWAAYFEPQAVLEKTRIKRRVDGGNEPLSGRTHSWA